MQNMASASASKKILETKKDKRRCRKLTGDELEQFTIVLSDWENCFVLNLEKLASKKSPNNEAVGFNFTG